MEYPFLKNNLSVSRRSTMDATNLIRHLEKRRKKDFSKNFY